MESSPLDHYRSLCRLRSTLEAFAIRHLTEQPTRKSALMALQRRLAPMQRCARAGNYEAFHQADTQFHRELIAVCAVPTLGESWEAVMRATDREVLEVKKAYWPSLMALYREHELLFEAWAGPDPAVAEQATHQHLEMGFHRMIQQSGEAAEADAVERVAAFLSTHLGSKVDLEWAAGHIGFLSLRHLSRRFRARFGLAPHAWLRRLRLERAAQLLIGSDLAVAEVGRRCGYGNASHFARDFRVFCGCSPQRYATDYSSSGPYSLKVRRSR